MGGKFLKKHLSLILVWLENNFVSWPRIPKLRIPQTHLGSSSNWVPLKIKLASTKPIRCHLKLNWQQSVPIRCHRKSNSYQSNQLGTTESWIGANWTNFGSPKIKSRLSNCIFFSLFFFLVSIWKGCGCV